MAEGETLSHTSEPDRKRRRPQRAKTLAEAAQERSLRFQAPAAAVDPLLSLLFDIRRLEQRVVSALESLGVDREDLALGRAAAPPPALHPVTSTSPTNAVAPEPTDAIAAYMAAAQPQLSSANVDPTGQKAMAVEAVLQWLDESTTVTAAGPDTDDTQQQRATSRRILAGLVAAQAPAPPLVLTSGGEPRAKAAAAGTEGRHRGTARQAHRESAVSFCPAADADTTGMVSLGSFDATVVEGWGRYADGLSVAIAEMHPLLHSLCATSIAATRSSHAKWVEVSTAECDKPFSVPSCASMKAGFEHVIRASDALASCQAAVRERLLSFEDALEGYTEEAAVVCRIEDRYWRNVRVFELEYNALRAMKRAITHVQRAFRREEGIAIQPTYKGYMARNAEIGGDRQRTP